MWNIPTEGRLDQIPKLYETENVQLQDKLIYLHFFIGGCDWYICEYDREDLFFGFAILNSDYQNAEWGYASFSELTSVKAQGWLEVDCELEDFWKIKKASEIDKIRLAQGWPEPTKVPILLTKEQELVVKVKAGHFRDFQDLFAEVTSPYSNFFGVDPNRIWEVANGSGKD